MSAVWRPRPFRHWSLADFVDSQFQSFVPSALMVFEVSIHSLSVGGVPQLFEYSVIQHIVR